MKLYLVRHGTAESAFTDPTRPLSRRGQSEVACVAEAVARAGASVGVIYHSVKTRARQSAEIFADHLHPQAGTQEIQGLNPNDDPGGILPVIQAAEEDIVLVGHLPYMGRLSSLLLTGDSDRMMIGFHTATTACFSGEADQWWLEFLLHPGLVNHER